MSVTNDFGELLQQTHDNVLLIKERMQTIEERQVKVEHAVFGNGKPGLRDDVRDLKSAERFRSRLGWIIIGALATPLTAGVVGAVVYLIVHMNAKP